MEISQHLDLDFASLRTTRNKSVVSHAAGGFLLQQLKPTGFWQYPASAQTLLVQSGLLSDPFPGCSGKQRFSMFAFKAQVAVTSSSLLLCYSWHLDCNYGISQGEMQVYSHVPMFLGAGNSPTVVHTCMVIGSAVLYFLVSLPQEVSLLFSCP